jgi:hypothetical protein
MSNFLSIVQVAAPKSSRATLVVRAVANEEMQTRRAALALAAAVIVGLTAVEAQANGAAKSATGTSRRFAQWC